MSREQLFHIRKRNVMLQVATSRTPKLLGSRRTPRATRLKI